LNPDENECVSDTCDNFPGLCASGDECVSVAGAFGCKTPCGEGFARDSAGACEDIDECLSSPCSGPNQACTNSEGSFSCDCAEGFSAYGDGSCAASKCNNFPALCVAGEECVGVEGAFSCLASCSYGFARSAAGDCEDVDECLSSPCGANQACSNTEGSFSCDCAENYRASADGSCVASNCNNFADVCSDSQDCVGFLGMYTCSDKCAAGYKRSGPSCRDVDECLTDPCSENAVCRNTAGSYSCDCAENFRASADGSCLASNCNNFADVCSNSQDCVEFLGVYACSDKCAYGYKRVGPSSSSTYSCEDVDECLDRPCQVNEDCTNTQGSYECKIRVEPDDGLHQPAESCKSDSCTGVNEVCNIVGGKISCDCDAGFEKLNGACLANTCTNFPGLCGYEEDCVDAVCVAACLSGYSRSAGGVCEDVDECLNNPCEGQANQVCANTAGSFVCECVSGFSPVVLESGAFKCEADDEPEDLVPVVPVAPIAPKSPSEPNNFVCAASCWTRECDHCSSKTTCGINYDLENNPLTIRSKGLRAKTFLKVVMYSENSKLLGTISFNSRGVFLWGCIACRQLKFRPRINRENPQVWVLNKSGNDIKITLDGRTIFEDTFNGKCAELYGVAVTKIAFQKTVFAEIASIPGMVPDSGYNPAQCNADYAEKNDIGNLVLKL